MVVLNNKTNDFFKNSLMKKQGFVTCYLKNNFKHFYLISILDSSEIWKLQFCYSEHFGLIITQIIYNYIVIRSKGTSQIKAQ